MTTLPRNVADAYPLSPMQRLMLLHAIASGGNGVLLNQVCYDIRGGLDVLAFRRAWDAVVERHPSLRTAFLWERLPQPLQVVRSTVSLPFRHVELSNLPAGEREAAVLALQREDAGTMALGQAPLMRCTLATFGLTHHRFVWTVHHLVVDRWSHGVLFAELRALYAAAGAGTSVSLPPPAPFRDYVDWIARRDASADEQFWRSELAGLREPTLLAGDSRSASGRRLTTRHVLGDGTTDAIRDRAASWRTTTGALVLAATALVMARRTGRDDVLCGITVAGRPADLLDAESMVGSLVNNLPARLTVDRERPVGDWVRQLQRAQARREVHGHVAVSDVHAWSDIPPARSLFDTLVLLNLIDDSDVPWPGITLTPVTATLDAAYPVLLSVTMEAGRLALTAIHGETLPEPRALLEDLEAALVRIASAPADAVVADVTDPTPWIGEPRGSGVNVPSASTPTKRELSDGTLADRLLGAWREILDVDPIGLDDDFFALGGTSLQAARLFARVERITGRTMPLSTLFAAGSVRALLAAIDQPEPRRGCLVRLRTAGRRPPIYAIPGIGGNVVGLAALARALGPDQPFVAFESPGLDGHEPPLDSIDAIADRYARELAAEAPREFTLLGLCWGAAVVAEMARKLAARGHPPNGIALIDPTSILRDSAARYGQGDVSFLKSRLALYWDEFRDGDWTDRTRLLATKARRAAQLAVGRTERQQTEGELRQFRVSEANKNAVIQYHPSALAVRARLFLTRYRGEGDDPRLEWRSIIEPTPDVVAVDGRNAGDAIAPTHATSLAESLGCWLQMLMDESARVGTSRRG